MRSTMDAIAKGPAILFDEHSLDKYCETSGPAKGKDKKSFRGKIL